MDCCLCGLQNVAANGFSDKVSVVHRDVGLERGQGARRLGANVVIADMLDAGLLDSQLLNSTCSYAACLRLTCQVFVQCLCRISCQSMHVATSATLTV